MKKLLLISLLLLLITPVLANQVIERTIDIRDIPYTERIPITVEAGKGETIIVNSTGWITPEQSEYLVPNSEQVTVMVDLLVPLGTEMGDYSEKVYLFNADERNEIFVNINVNKTTKKSNVVVKLINLLTDDPISNATVKLYQYHNQTGMTDTSGSIVFTDVEEGSTDLNIEHENYEERNAVLHLAGVDQKYTFYLLPIGASVSGTDQEVRVYRNILAEHQEFLERKTFYEQGFILKPVSNETCPTKQAYDNLKSDLKSCVENRDIALRMANLSVDTNLSRKDENDKLTLYAKIFLWVLFISIALIIVYYILRKAGAFEGVG